MKDRKIYLHKESGVIHTAFSNFTPFADFESLLLNTIEEMKDQRINTWIIDLTDVVILGRQHLNYFIELCLPRIKHLEVTNIKIIKSKFNFDTSFERNLKRALSSMQFNFEYTLGVHSLT